MARTIVSLGMLILLAGCVAPAPVIVDLETDKVKVQSGMGTKPEDVHATARKGCAMHNRVPKPLSEQCFGQYCVLKHTLFACVERRPIKAHGTDESRRALGLPKNP